MRESRISHLRILGCPVYIDVPKEKRTKLDPSGKKGIFVGYSDTLKAYRVYISSFKNIETNRDVTFDEDTIFSRLRQIHSDEVHEEVPEAPRARDTVMEESIPKGYEDHDMIEPQRSTLRGEHSQEKTSLGTRDHPRCREIWCSRRDLQIKKETLTILQLCIVVM